MASEDRSSPQQPAAEGPVVIVMAKAPRAGYVKTRLCPPLTPAEAAELAAAFLQDSAANALASGAAVMIAFAPGEARGEIEALAPAAALWTPQRGASLGERMAAALADAWELGFSPALLVGTDSPTLPAGVLQVAISALAAGPADVALGPTDDGGFYLAGARGPVPGLFDAVDWSTPRALAGTLRNAERLGLRVAMLPQWYDIDTPRDLDRLRAELRDNAEAQERARHTRKWLDEHEDFDNRPYA